MPVLSCAGAYVSGAAGSNECPAGSVRIVTRGACRAAAAAAGKTAGSTVYPFVETDRDVPRGCYYTTGGNAHLNADADGFGASYARLLCAAVATTGAPLHAPTRVCCACAARYSRAAGLIIQTA